MKNRKLLCFGLYDTILSINTDETDDLTYQVFAEYLKEYTGNIEDWKVIKEIITKNYENEKLIAENMSNNSEMKFDKIFYCLLDELNIDLKYLSEIAYKFRVASRSKILMYKDVKDTLLELKHNFRLALITNSYSSFVLPEMNMFGLNKIFDYYVISSELGYRKPAKNIFDIVFKKYNRIKPEDSFMIGSGNESDIAGGIGYNMKTVQIIREDNLKNESMNKYKPDFIISSFTELSNILSSND